jgi:hypothetical protein
VGEASELRSAAVPSPVSANALPRKSPWHLQPIDPTTSSPDGPTQLASYTIGSSGALTTSSTDANMPSTTVEPILNLSMAPSGKLLAVTGSNDIEIFWFNGASLMKAYKTLLSGVDIEHAYWDNANHLYAISQDKRRLYVFTVTTTSTSQAPGSPHSITGPQNIIVQRSMSNHHR